MSCTKLHVESTDTRIFEQIQRLKRQKRAKIGPNQYKMVYFGMGHKVATKKSRFFQ